MSSLIKPTPTRVFLKDHTDDMRIGDDAVERLSDLLTDAAAHIAARARESALDEDRNTLMTRDIQAGFESFLQTQGPSLFSTETIHAAIDGITNEALTELIIDLQSALEGLCPHCGHN